LWVEFSWISFLEAVSRKQNNRVENFTLRILRMLPTTTTNKKKKKSSGRGLLIYFLEVVAMFKSSVVLSLVKSVESVLKTDQLAVVVSCVRIS
jgi:hypothetical protein